MLRSIVIVLVTVFQAGKFDVIPTMINIGSGLVLFGVVSDTACTWTELCVRS